MRYDPVLENALHEYRIPYPQNRASSNGFIRWGKNQRYWAIQVDDGFFFGDFATDLSTAVFPNREVNDYDTKTYSKRVSDLIEQTDQERNYFYIKTKERAQKIWETSACLTYSHDYLVRKKSVSSGLKIAGEGCLIIPLYDINGELWTLQFIDANGTKRFLKNGKKSGNFFMFGKPQNRIYICEGYATASSVYQAVKECVVACFDAGNLSKVALQLAQKYPKAALVFCADNDRFNLVNVGIEKAKNSAQSLKAKVVYPVFDEKDTQSTDFNDLHCWYGLNFVRQQIITSLGE